MAEWNGLVVAIGQSSAASVPLDSAFARRKARAGEGQLLEQSRAREGRSTDVIQAGFGKDTLSPQGAALETVATGLERARELVPSVEELRAQAAQAAAEAEARLEELRAASESARKESEAAAPATVSARPKAEPLAIRFFGGPKLVVAKPEPAEAQPAPSAAAARFVAQESTPAVPGGNDGSAALLDLIA